MEEVDDEQFDLQFVEAKRKSIIVRSDSSPGFLSKVATVTDGEPIPPKERFSIVFQSYNSSTKINRPKNWFFRSKSRQATEQGF